MLKSASVGFFKRTINIFGVAVLKSTINFTTRLQLREKFNRLRYINLPKAILRYIINTLINNLSDGYSAIKKTTIYFLQKVIKKLPVIHLHRRFR
jgi:hypothetical protein